MVEIGVGVAVGAIVVVGPVQATTASSVTTINRGFITDSFYDNSVRRRSK